MGSPTSDAISRWWELPAVLQALTDRRWDTVVHAAIEAGASQQDIAAACSLSQPYVSRIASGARVPRQQATIAALCDGLGIPRHLAGLADAPEEQTTDRRAFLSTTGLAAAATAVATIVPQDALQELGAPMATYRRADAYTSSQLLRPPAGAHLNMLRHMAAEAENDNRTADAKQLHALISEAAGFNGWLAIDADDRPTARRSYKLAVQAAAQTRHVLLTVYMTGSLAQFAAIDGDLVNAQAITKRARVALPANAPPIALAWLDCIEASILASARNDRALELLDDASRKLTAAEPVWPWLTRFDAAKLDTYRSTVYVRLRREPAQWPKPVNPMTAPHPKQAADRMMERATALLDLGHPEKACAIAGAVFDTARRFKSERLTRAVRDLRTGLGNRVTGTEIDALDMRLATMYEQE